MMFYQDKQYLLLVVGGGIVEVKNLKPEIETCLNKR